MQLVVKPSSSRRSWIDEALFCTRVHQPGRPYRDAGGWNSVRRGQGRYRDKQIEGGGRYIDINPKGYVPALVFDDGEVLTENVAILAWVADRAPELAPQGHLGRYRLLEMLSFIATEIHKRFPTYLMLPEDVREPIAQEILRWFRFAAGRLERGYLFGKTFTVADPYLFQLARGAAELGFQLPEPLRDYIARIEEPPAVQAALRREGLA
ncbi:glutathione S-transferase N-terminal domain-containing protein [Mesorhizobium sp.]|uniref:glutathione S-transferase N-terminal domain-containing protein n=1 Tax=Mesorhizobium sp. TaxID=1871066 RepID=UPI00257DF8BF|nr:glutathione S-transferase N-terminal domain-containing protein [Mesorhizobium sp.]